MTIQKIIFISLICLSTIPLSVVHSQGDFVQFTRFDHLRWSPDGRQLACRCVLLDEAQPERALISILTKDLDNGDLRFLNPIPERMVVSSHDKNLCLFSSVYGLYLVKIDPPSAVRQILFRDPTADWQFGEFGFADNSQSLFYERIASGFGAGSKTLFRIQLESNPFLASSLLKSIEAPTQIIKSHYNLPVAELTDRQLLQFQVKKQKLFFQNSRSIDSSDSFDLTLSAEPDSATVLIRNCRPRFISFNPDSSFAIVTVFQDEQLLSYILELESRRLTLIQGDHYRSVSWLSRDQYVCIKADALFSKIINQPQYQPLDQPTIPEWCLDIPLKAPKFELQVGFFENKQEADSSVAFWRDAGQPARISFIQNQDHQGYRVRMYGYATLWQARVVAKNLKTRGIPCWVDQIRDIYDYFNSSLINEEKIFGEQTAVIEYRKQEYLQSRIVLIENSGHRKIVVPEMNNIAERENW